MAELNFTIALCMVYSHALPSSLVNDSQLLLLLPLFGFVCASLPPLPFPLSAVTAESIAEVHVAKERETLPERPIVSFLPSPLSLQS